MLRHPVIFVAANLVLMFAACSVMGISGSIVVSLAVTVFVVLYNWQRSSINAVVLGILYQLLFDSQLYSYTSLNLRAWYLLLILLYAGLLVRLVRGRGAGVFSFRQLMANLPVLLLFGLSLALLVVDPTDGRASNIKYWMFYVGLVYVLLYYLKRIEREDLKLLLDFLISLTVFLCLWGIFEFGMNLRGSGRRYMYDYMAVNPSGFFSETTWYAVYIVFGMALLFLRLRLFGGSALVVLLVPFGIGVVFSANRNALLSMALLVALNACFWVIGGVVAYRSTLRNRYLLLVVVLVAAVVAVNWSILAKYYVLIVGKFDLLRNESSVGRIVATQNSFKEIAASPVFGNGFAWYPGQVTGTGTYTGSKSFNLFFMIAYIFGLVGFIPFLGMLLWFLLQKLLEFIRTGDLLKKYSFLLMAVFVSISMFTPLHQQAIGMWFVALAVALGSAGARWATASRPDVRADGGFLAGATSSWSW